MAATAADVDSAIKAATQAEQALGSGESAMTQADQAQQSAVSAARQQADAAMRAAVNSANASPRPDDE